MPQMYFITNHVITSLYIYILLQRNCKRQQKQEENDNRNKKEEFIKEKVLNNKKAFLLIDLLGDISDLREEERLVQVATSTKSL